MRNLGWGAAALALAAGAAGLALAQTPAPAPLEVRILAHVAVGAMDSALALVRAERSRIPGIVEQLLIERARAARREQADSAAARLHDAGVIAGLHADASRDSFQLRLVEFEAGLAPERLPLVARGWDEYGRGAQLDRTWQFAELQKILPELVGASEESGDAFLQVRVRRLAGRAHVMTGAVEEGRRLFGEALQGARELGDRYNELQILLQTAWAYGVEERLDKELEILRDVMEPLRREGDWGLYLPAIRSLALNHMRRGELDSSLVWFRRGTSKARELGWKRYECIFLWQTGHALGSLGDYEPGVRHVEEALTLAREIGEKGPELGAVISLAWLYGEQEQYTRALAVLRQGLPVAQETGMQEAIGNISTQIGEIYFALGRPDEALRHYREILPSMQKSAFPGLLSSVLRDMARAELHLGRLPEATRLFAEALRSVAGLPSPMYVAWACLDLGSAHAHGGELDLAEPYLVRAQALADSLGNPFLLGETERMLAQIAAKRGDRDGALALLDRAIQRGRSVGATTLLRQALVDKADYLHRLSDLEGADSLLAEAIDIVESVRGRQAGENLRLGFLSDKKSIYAARVAVLYELGASGGAAAARHVEAFHVAEQARARSLLDVVSGTQADPGDTVEPSLRDREHRLAARLSELQTALSQAVAAEAWEAARVDSLESLHASTVQEYRACLDEIAARSPAYAALAGQRPVLGLDEIRSRVLAEDQVLLEYLVGERETYLFLVDRERLRVVRIPTRADSLAAHVAALRGVVAPANAAESPAGGTESVQGTADGTKQAVPGAGSNVLSPLQQLFAVLVRPVADDIGDGTRLVIVPDGPLFHLPFAALHDGERFLVERHAVAYAPSASVLDPELRKGKRRGGNVLLAVGNPATFRSTELLTSLRDAERWRFGALPYAEEEVVRIAAHCRQASTLTGDAATEEAVKSAIGRARYVHFATHGLLDEDEPMWSGLVLAQDDDPAEDGLLQAHEILKLDLAADLVALSACNTGLGRLAGGEGVIGLTRAFLYAGARAVLVSLWEVADRSTMDLMSSFYAARLERGLLPDVALQQAQVAALAAGGTVREWAPFLLMGSPATAAPSTLPARLLVLLAVLTLIPFVVLRWGRRKKPRMRAAAGGA